jgi:hypothetical protein
MIDNNPENKPLEIGDAIRYRYGDEAEKIPRKIRFVEWNYLSRRWYASADGGEPCPHCGRTERVLHGPCHWFEKIT